MLLRVSYEFDSRCGCQKPPKPIFRFGWLFSSSRRTIFVLCTNWVRISDESCCQLASIRLGRNSSRSEPSHKVAWCLFLMKNHLLFSKKGPIFSPFSTLFVSHPILIVSIFHWSKILQQLLLQYKKMVPFPCFQIYNTHP